MKIRLDLCYRINISWDFISIAESVLATCFLFLRYFYVYNPIEKLSLKGYNYNVCIVQLKMIHSVFLFVIDGV